MDVDVLGLVEIENDFLAGGLSPDPVTQNLGDPAVATLVDAVNDRLGADIYSWVDPGQEFVGSDAIANAMIYKQDEVFLNGEMAILTEFEGQSFLDPLGAGRDLNRAAIAVARAAESSQLVGHTVPRVGTESVWPSISS